MSKNTFIKTLSILYLAKSSIYGNNIPNINTQKKVNEIYNKAIKQVIKEIKVK